MNCGTSAALQSPKLSVQRAWQLFGQVLLSIKKNIAIYMGCSELCRLVIRKSANIDPKSVTWFSNLCEAFLEPQSTDLTQKFQRQQAPCGCWRWNFWRGLDRWVLRKASHKFEFGCPSVTLLPRDSPNFRSRGAIHDFPVLGPLDVLRGSERLDSCNRWSLWSIQTSQ